MITERDWIKLLVATVCEEWGSIKTWSLGLHDFDYISGDNELKKKLPDIIDLLDFFMNICDSELVFRDFSHAFDNLKKEKQSPVNVRRYFRSFIEQSQQLTNVMYKEYPRLTGKEWDAKNFLKWNAITVLFKKLRRSDYHEFPVLVHVNETQHYFNHGQFLGAKFTWELGDPFSDEIPKGIIMLEADPETGKPIYEKKIEPRARSFKYVLHPRTKEIKNALKQAGTNDVHRLSEKCFEILKEYYNYYNECIKKNRKP